MDIPQQARNLDFYGKSISILIIYLVVAVSFILIIDELINITIFSYNYTYNYNYGNINEKVCNNDSSTSVLEYEKARYRIFNIINKYKFKKDLFNKNWVNYLSFVVGIILTIIFFLSFGTLFYFFFINEKTKCSTNTANIPENQRSFLKVSLKCAKLDTIDEYIPNCTINYIVLLLIIVVYPLIYLLKGFFRKDYTWYAGGLWNRLFHILVFITLVFYIFTILSESEEEDKNKDKKTRALIYITFITIFYISQYIYEFIDDDYNKNYKPTNIYDETENNKNDVMFFDIYKQEEPIKPIEPKKPEKTDAAGNKSDLLLQFQYKNAKQIAALQADATKQSEYKKDLGEVTTYYNKKKEYDEKLKVYNDKFNIYKNASLKFPALIGIFDTMMPKMIGLDKTTVIIIIVMIIISIALYAVFAYYKNSYADFFYYTIFIYLVGIFSIILISNSILTYNTYFNKFHIYEPISQYKYDVNKLNVLLNICLEKNNDNLLDLYNRLLPENKKIFTVTPSSSSTSSFNEDTFKEDIRKIKDNTSPLLIAPITDYTPSSLTTVANFINIGIYNSLLNVYQDYDSTTPANNNNIYMSCLNSKKPNFIITDYSFLDTTNNFKFYYSYTVASGETAPSKLINVSAFITTSTTSDDYIKISTFFKILRGTAINDLNKLSEKIKGIKNNIKYLIIKQTPPFPPPTTDTTYLYTYLYNLKTAHNLDTDKTDEEIADDNFSVGEKPNLDLYKNNLYYIDLILNFYGDFIKDVRAITIRLFNNSGIPCDAINAIDLSKKIDMYETKFFYKKSDKSYQFKTEATSLYKKILENAINEFNDTYDKYFNIIRYISYTKLNATSSSLATDANFIKIRNQIIANYNIYNSGDKKFMDNNFILKKIILEANQIYSRQPLMINERKKLDTNINNVSWSFIILIIIFAIILIEPIII